MKILNRIHSLVLWDNDAYASKSFLLFLFLSINISITAQSKETKYVSSNGGLNLRNAPNTDGKRLS